MGRGRRRKPDPTIPDHIDQQRIPVGVYWDRSGSGRWYVREAMPGGSVKCRTIAGPKAQLSDLHRIVEETADPSVGTVDHLLALFEASPAFAALARSSQRDYRASRSAIANHPTKLGVPFGRLQLARISAPVIQRLVDAVAEKTPTKALHMQQYLRRVLRWGVNRGHCASNPAIGIEAPKLSPRRRLPSADAHNAILRFCAERGQRQAHTSGSVAPYLWACAELAYLCHMRGCELLDLTEASATSESLLADRRKGSRSTRFRWTPRLRAAWDAAISLRDYAWRTACRPIPMRPEDRRVIVGQGGEPLRKSSLDTAWQRMMHQAIAAGVIAAGQRFGLHDLKRKGATDRVGTRPEKQDATGHRSAQMLDVYDLSVPLVDPAGTAPQP